MAQDTGRLPIQIFCLQTRGIFRSAHTLCVARRGGRAVSLRAMAPSRVALATSTGTKTPRTEPPVPHAVSTPVARPRNRSRQRPPLPQQNKSAGTVGEPSEPTEAGRFSRGDCFSDSPRVSDTIGVLGVSRVTDPLLVTGLVTVTTTGLSSACFPVVVSLFVSESFLTTTPSLSSALSR